MKRKTLSANFDKKALLETFPNANHAWIHRKVNAIEMARTNQIADERILCDSLNQMFPDQEYVLYSVSKLKYQDKKERINQTYTAEYLPLHTRDNAWLTRYAYQVASERDPQVKLKWKYVENYVAESPAFDIMRNEYEQRVLRAQIPYMLNKPTPNGLMDENCCPHNYNGLPNFDRFFRNEVIRCMARFGMDEHNVEIALERSADLWREQSMIQSFENVYYPLTVLTDIHKSIDPWWRRLDKLKQAHQSVWLKVREYEYYQDHHEVIDELGLATENMQLKPSEVEKAKKKLIKFERIRDRMLAGDTHDFVPQPERSL